MKCLTINMLIGELIEILIYKQPCIDDGDMDDDDSVEPLIVNANNAANGLEIVHSFLQQQDSKVSLKHVRMLEHYISLSQ